MRPAAAEAALAQSPRAWVKVANRDGEPAFLGGESMVITSAFVAYAITALVLSLDLIVLWAMSGGVRAGTKTALNAEDASLFKVAVVDVDPAPVARVLRAHRNAEANIYPFLILGLIYVLAGASYLPAVIIFAVFTAARLLHSIFYVRGGQPWRTISFAVGAFATLALMIAIVMRLIAIRQTNALI